jgi:hypothetical protein
MRQLSRAILAGGLGFAVALLVAACGGGSGLLSSDQASSLNGQLDQVSSAVNAGNCGAASSAAASLTNAVSNLPPSVNTTLRNNLDQGASTVSQLAQRDCRHTTSTTTSTSTTSSTSTTATTPKTTTTQTSTSNTHTAPPPTTSTSGGTPPGPGTTSTSSGSGGAGLGGGNGNGQ